MRVSGRGTLRRLPAMWLLVSLGLAAMPIAQTTAGDTSRITMTVLNWGAPVSLLDPAVTAWAHPAAQAGDADVTATMELHGLVVHSWSVHLDAPESFGGVQPTDCRGSEEAAPKELSCVFAVPVSSGENPIHVTFTADGTVIGETVGMLRGGVLSWDAGYEVLDVSGRWEPIVHDETVDLPGTAKSALRYSVTNTGTIPLRLLSLRGDEADSCADRTLGPGQEITCPLKGVRPAQSIAGRYLHHIQLRDAAGGGASFDIRGAMRAFAGTFTLSRSTASPGQRVVVTAHGLPHGGVFEVQYRLDDQTETIGSAVTRSGAVNFSFVLPSSSSPGPTRVHVEHDGITLASLPLAVTRFPVVQDATAPRWGLLAVPIVVLAGLFAVWRFFWRPRRRLSRLGRDAGSRARRPKGSYPDAIPATQEREAARRS